MPVIDPLQAKIDRALKLAETRVFEMEKKQATSISGYVDRTVIDTATFYYQVTHGIYWILQNILYPILRVISIPIKYIGQLYMKLWNWVVFSKPDQYGVKKLYKYRAGLMICFTILFISGWHVYTDAITFALTAKHHIVWLDSSQELHETHNVFSAKGCDHGKVCSDDDAIYYRMDPDLFNQIWSFSTRGRFYFPEQVAGAIRSVIQPYHAYSYGFRWKWLMRNWEVYPELLILKPVEQ